MNQRIREYEILGELGHGGMGVVYRARHALTGEEVALKCIHKELGRNEEARKRFVREAQIMRSLEHRNILRCFEVFEEKGELYLVTEKLEGQSVQEWAGQAGGADIKAFAALFAQMVDAVAYAHERGVLHRDLKPQNAQVTPVGVVKILDFGLARDFSRSAMTGTGQMFGTILYLPPEVVSGEVDVKDMGPEGDVYALGAIAYRVLAGQLPFGLREDSSPMKAARLVAEHLAKGTPVRDIRELRPEVPPGFAGTIMAALAIKPENRPKDADKLKALLLEPKKASGPPQLPPQKAPVAQESLTGLKSRFVLPKMAEGKVSTPEPTLPKQPPAPLPTPKPIAAPVPPPGLPQRVVEVQAGQRSHPAWLVSVLLAVGAGAAFAGVVVVTELADRDEDGVLDEADSCPTQSGAAALNGCPDSDGDQIADPDDKCPADRGPSKNQGCPSGDKNGGGVEDKEDKGKNDKVEVPAAVKESPKPEPEPKLASPKTKNKTVAGLTSGAKKTTETNDDDIDLDSLLSAVKAGDKNKMKTAGSGGGGTLTKPEIQATVKKYYPQIQACLEKQKQHNPNVKGKLLMNWIVQPNGSATLVSVGSPAFNGTFVAKCIQAIINTWKFPTFEGKPVPIANYPFQLQ